MHIILIAYQGSLQNFYSCIHLLGLKKKVGFFIGVSIIIRLQGWFCKYVEINCCCRGFSSAFLLPNRATKIVQILIRFDRKHSARWSFALDRFFLPSIFKVSSNFPSCYWVKKNSYLFWVVSFSLIWFKSDPGYFCFYSEGNRRRRRLGLRVFCQPYKLQCQDKVMMAHLQLLRFTFSFDFYQSVPNSTKSVHWIQSLLI